jgi:hypothetical protein
MLLEEKKVMLKILETKISIINFLEKERKNSIYLYSKN